jgi:hypothetical protein
MIYRALRVTKSVTKKKSGYTLPRPGRSGGWCAAQALGAIATVFRDVLSLRVWIFRFIIRNSIEGSKVLNLRSPASGDPVVVSDGLRDL